MKFRFEYRTSDNVRHEDVVFAANREAAFASLRQKGIRPIRVEEAPGILNKLFGKGKRWIAIVCLSAVAVLALMLFRESRIEVKNVTDVFDSKVRRQVLGEASVVARGIKTGWADFFELQGERLLASFAVPGTAPAVGGATEDELLKALEAAPKPVLTSSTALEERQIRAMVEGMKDELRKYLSRGGTVEKYLKRIKRRQTEEIGYYNRAKNEVEVAVRGGMREEDIDGMIEDRNSKLRAMGIRLVQKPE